MSLPTFCCGRPWRIDLQGTCRGRRPRKCPTPWMACYVWPSNSSSQSGNGGDGPSEGFYWWKGLFLFFKKYSPFIKDVDCIFYDSIHDTWWIELVFGGLHVFKEGVSASDSRLVFSLFDWLWPFDVECFPRIWLRLRTVLNLWFIKLCICYAFASVRKRKSLSFHLSSTPAKLWLTVQKQI